MRIFLFFLSLTLSLIADNGAARVVALSGEVHVYRDNMLMLFKEGMELIKGDLIESKDDGRATIIFYDETIVTIGNNTSFSIEKYLDNRQNSAMELKAIRGILRIVSGNIGNKTPKNLMLTTLTMNIQIHDAQLILAIDDTKEQYLCTKGKTPLSLNIQSNLKVSDLIKSPFMLDKKQHSNLEAAYILYDNDMAEFVKFIDKTDKQPTLNATTKLSNITARRVKMHEAEKISSKLQDGYGVVVDRNDIITQYKNAMDLPPQEPIIIRELNNPNPTLKTPKLHDTTNPDKLLDEIAPIGNK